MDYNLKFFQIDNHLPLLDVQENRKLLQRCGKYGLFQEIASTNTHKSIVPLEYYHSLMT